MMVAPQIKQQGWINRRTHTKHRVGGEKRVMTGGKMTHLTKVSQLKASAGGITRELPSSVKGFHLCWLNTGCY